MASSKDFVDFIAEQLRNLNGVNFRKMFGEYAVYCNSKVVALICDNRFFVKPTPGGRAYIGNPVEAPAYPGAKNSFLIEDKLDDADWLSELVQITFNELPEPKKKALIPKKKTKSSNLLLFL